MAKILIVEDESSINRLIAKTLTIAGHYCVSAYLGEEALNQLHETVFDLVLLDINLPDIDGFEVARRIEKTPIIFVTARDEIDDRLRGLLGGAEDYIVKPFVMEELLARVYVVLRRFNKADEEITFHNVKVSLKDRKVFLNHSLVHLASQEYALLEVLVLNRNIALSRTKLLDLAWGLDFDGDERTVDVHIQRLRKKLELEEEIKTIYKYGYRLEV